MTKDSNKNQYLSFVQVKFLRFFIHFPSLTCNRGRSELERASVLRAAFATHETKTPEGGIVRQDQVHSRKALVHTSTFPFLLHLLLHPFLLSLPTQLHPLAHSRPKRLLEEVKKVSFLDGTRRRRRRRTFGSV